jgi:hypothetical protein
MGEKTGARLLRGLRPIFEQMRDLEDMSGLERTCAYEDACPFPFLNLAPPELFPPTPSASYDVFAKAAACRSAISARSRMPMASSAVPSAA